MGKERIAFREWITCLSALFCVGSLFLVSLGGKPLNEFNEDREWQEKMKVFVSGAVLRPGEYEVRIGSSLKSVLKKAGFESFADKKAVYSKKTLINSCEIFVPRKSVNNKNENNDFKISK